MLPSVGPELYLECRILTVRKNVSVCDQFCICSLELNVA